MAEVEHDGASKSTASTLQQEAWQARADERTFRHIKKREHRIMKKKNENDDNEASFDRNHLREAAAIAKETSSPCSSENNNPEFKMGREWKGNGGKDKPQETFRQRRERELCGMDEEEADCDDSSTPSFSDYPGAYNVATTILAENRVSSEDNPHTTKSPTAVVEEATLPHLARSSKKSLKEEITATIVDEEALRQELVGGVVQAEIVTIGSSEQRKSWSYAYLALVIAVAALIAVTLAFVLRSSSDSDNTQIPLNPGPATTAPPTRDDEEFPPTTPSTLTPGPATTRPTLLPTLASHTNITVALLSTGTWSKEGNRRPCAWDRCPSDGFHWDNVGSEECSCEGGLNTCYMNGPPTTVDRFEEVDLVPILGFDPTNPIWKLQGSGDNSLMFGQGGDCASGSECFDPTPDPLRGGFRVDLSQTQYEFHRDSLVTVDGWSPHMLVLVDGSPFERVGVIAETAEMKIPIPAGKVVEVSCGGWCGQCNSELFVVLES